MAMNLIKYINIVCFADATQVSTWLLTRIPTQPLGPLNGAPYKQLRGDMLNFVSP